MGTRIAECTSMDNPCRLRRLCPLPNTPLPHFVRARGEEACESQRSPHRDDDLADGALDAEFLAFLGDLLITEAGEAFLEGNRKWDDDVAGAVLVDPGFDLGEVLIFLADVVFLREVDEEDDRLSSEELELVDDFDLAEECVC